MQSSAKTVDDYLAEIPETRREVLNSVRAAIREVIPELEESMKYGMAAYTRPGESEPEVAFASQAKYISIYFPVPVVDAKRHLLDGLSVGKCCVRYSSPNKVNVKVVEELLKETIRQYRA
ncbi:MAG: DUF1801 domain-containing protein [Armatimonadota bacterium]